MVHNRHCNKHADVWKQWSQKLRHGCKCWSPDNIKALQVVNNCWIISTKQILLTTSIMFGSLLSVCTFIFDEQECSVCQSGAQPCAVLSQLQAFLKQRHQSGGSSHVSRWLETALIHEGDHSCVSYLSFLTLHCFSQTSSLNAGALITL